MECVKTLGRPVNKCRRWICVGAEVASAPTVVGAELHYIIISSYHRIIIWLIHRRKNVSQFCPKSTKKKEIILYRYDDLMI